MSSLVAAFVAVEPRAIHVFVPRVLAGSRFVHESMYTTGGRILGGVKYETDVVFACSPTKPVIDENLITRFTPPRASSLPRAPADALLWREVTYDVGNCVGVPTAGESGALGVSGPSMPPIVVNLAAERRWRSQM